MANYNVKIVGLEEFKMALQRNPQRVATEVKRFLTLSIAAYNRGIIRNPWRKGMSGGGVPVLTGNLRDTHRTEIQAWQARIYPTAPYAMAVHEGTGRMRKRPWLDYVKQQQDSEVHGYETQMLANIVGDLAS
jgi:hypothetical protein